ncbi:molecular chaperone DnaK [Methanofollis fontis]|uniref:Chaperone protein DnaK n=1 Tax=Methanofollis fontis TaxID=2052832 RepID=A0A483CQ50_9EURY|nr:molecular chaperone DnaK [Methanofollis fontis]TAJ45243.1 molecular chaperone DnaK [Methanofollis fontis]
MQKEKIIGIDLGTSNSQAAVMIGGKPTIIPSAEGSTYAGKMFPSVVAFTKEGGMLVGEPARRQALTNPDGTVMAAKRRMGTDHRYRIFGKDYTPQQISAFLLQKIRRDAEAYLGETVTKAVITVPAYFNDNQRTATKDAGTIAGLEVVRLINEPTAASMAYGLDRGGEQKIMVFDFGGGTLDVTVMEFGEGTFRVISTAGDTHLGGTDMDAALVDWIAEDFRKQEGIDLQKDTRAIGRLREAAEQAKIELSTALETEITLPYITGTASGPKHLSMKLSRAKLEQIVAPVIDRCAAPLDQALSDAKIAKDGIDRVILVGGPTRMPCVQRFIEEHTGKKPERSVDPMECVAIGAAIQGAILAGEITDMVLLDVTPLTLGIETLGHVTTALIPRNTTIPTRASQVFTTAADLQTSVTINVLQGERPMAPDNTSLGQFNLVGLPPAPRGVPQIEVAFDIDASGILNVSARDLATEKEQRMTITASTKLPDAEVERMIREAQTFEEKDRKRKEEAEVRNDADSLIYTTEKTLADLGEKMGGAQKDALDAALASLKEAVAGTDLPAIRSATDRLRKVLGEAGASIYGGTAQRPGGPQQGEEYVDAEYRVKED